MPSSISLSEQFPELAPEHYLDSAATSLEAKCVRDAMEAVHPRGSVHRGLHAFSSASTALFEESRARVASFIHATPQEIVFTSGTTDSLNKLALMLTQNLGPDDEIVVTSIEHHSNFLPWQQAAKRVGATFTVLEVDIDTGIIDLEAARRALTPRTAIFACTAVSNALGTIQPTEELCALAKTVGAISVVDGAQQIPHRPVNVQSLGCDFYVFSAHKMYGPTGIGVLYGTHALLSSLDPVFYGGGMVHSVSSHSATWTDSPSRFEAGTPNLSGAVGLAAACTFLSDFGYDALIQSETQLIDLLITTLVTDPRLSGKVTIPGTHDATLRAGAVSFLVDGIHPHDIADLLGSRHVAIRAGHHCAMPLMDRLSVAGTARASVGMYTSSTDIHALIEGIAASLELFSRSSL